jgi:hypothetical protein
MSDDRSRSAADKDEASVQTTRRTLRGQRSEPTDPTLLHSDSPRGRTADLSLREAAAAAAMGHLSVRRSAGSSGTAIAPASSGYATVAVGATNVRAGLFPAAELLEPIPTQKEPIFRFGGAGKGRNDGRHFNGCAPPGLDETHVDDE